MKTFGDTLRELRVAQQLGLREMAGKAGISPAYLSRIERGKESPPSPEVIKSMARVLATDPDILFRLSSSTDPEIVDFLRSQPDVMKLLRFLHESEVGAQDIRRLLEFAKEITVSKCMDRSPSRST
ncbi:helix-turn-helix domain-containing protein [Allochromatium vinosum]|uniref:helix-turn-helix domain-containing protein n=1 Tax=Allochromatium vinosum TaxID=1049 RepID=UPI001908E872|nr:helix-turn-helix transcriptional regulator [Allochromatium vinosum]MBK1654914.1 transcriptional regulator [Allochromatium vinosum]